MHFLPFWALLSLAISCQSSNYDYSKFYSLKGQELKYQDTLKFEFTPQDTGLYKVYLSVRYVDTYEFSNCWLKVIEHGSIRRVNVPLFDKLGQPLGKSSGGVISKTVLLEKCQIDNRRLIKLEIVQNMRKNPLPGISELGIMIKKKD